MHTLWKFLGVATLALAAGACANDAGVAMGGPTRGVVIPSPGLTCPTDVPGGLRARIVDGGVVFEWNAIAGIPRYEIAVRRLESNQSAPEATLIAETNVFEWHPQLAGRFEARLRSVTSCGTTSDWSGGAQFSTDDGGSSETSPSPGPPVPQPPSPPPPDPTDDDDDDGDADHDEETCDNPRHDHGKGKGHDKGGGNGHDEDKGNTGGGHDNGEERQKDSD